MRRVWAVAKKEFWGYFNSMMAYAFALIFLGAVNFVYIWMILLPSAQVRLNYYFEVMIWGMWFIIPAITMRSWAEERRLRTDELLLTLPINDWEAVLGKYLAGVGFFSLILILSLGFRWEHLLSARRTGLRFCADIWAYFWLLAPLSPLE